MSAPRLSVEPAEALADEPFAIALAGLPAGARVRITGESNNLFCLNMDPALAYSMRHWHVQAEFVANADGTVYLERDTPVEGDWNQPCPAAPLPFLQPARQQPWRTQPAPSRLADVPAPQPYDLRITATVTSGATMESHATRRYLASNVRAFDVEDAGFVGRYFSSAHEKVLPAVIVISGSEGRIEKAQIIAALLASHGYQALALCYFGLENASQYLDRIPLELVERATQWLQTRPEIDSSRIALYGRSKGGELALAAASFIPAITCVVANTPSPWCYEGLRGKLPTRHASWTWRGAELPFVKIPTGVLARAPFALATNRHNFTRWLYEKTLTTSAVDDAYFPLERINGPVLVISSERDEVWPSRLHGDRAMAALDAAGFPHRHKHLVCQQASHTLTVPHQPARSLPSTIDHVAWTNDTQRAWSATLSFLDEWRHA